MKNRTFQLLFILLVLQWVVGYAQDKPHKLMFGGHLQNLNTIYVEKTNSEWYTLGSVYNRLNLKWRPNENWTLSASARNMFNYGQLIYTYYPLYSDLLVMDEGFADLTWTIAKDSSYILYTNIDRANIQYVYNKLDVKIGRQRINWGINLVWNPNDIFNTFNYYDFDYIERPGCDAIRLQYYTGNASSVELAFKIDTDEKITSAAMYRFNKWNYDFQLLGGVYRDDIVAGAGWSGYIKNAGFTGEGSYFIDRKNLADTTGIFIFSTGINYTLRNSIYLHGSMLFNSNGTNEKAGRRTILFVMEEVTPKTFTMAKYSIFGQISYPFTPLIQGDLSGIVNPNDGSFFLGPNFSFSLSDNITLLLIGQLFFGEMGTEFGDYGQLYYLRLKWSF